MKLEGYLRLFKYFIARSEVCFSLSNVEKCPTKNSVTLVLNASEQNSVKALVHYAVDTHESSCLSGSETDTNISLAFQVSLSK